MAKSQTPKEIRDILKRLTPEQRKLIAARVSEMFALHKRSQFKLIAGKRRDKSGG